MSENNKFNSTSVNNAKPPIRDGLEYIRLFLENIKDIFKPEVRSEIGVLAGGIYDDLIKNQGCSDYAIKNENCDELIINYLAKCKPEYTFTDEFNNTTKIINVSVEDVLREDDKNVSKFLENKLKAYRGLYRISLALVSQKPDISQLNQQELENQIKSYIKNEKSNEEKILKNIEKEALEERIVNSLNANRIPPKMAIALIIAGIAFVTGLTITKKYDDSKNEKEQEEKPKIKYSDSVETINDNKNNDIYDYENNEYIIRR